MGMGQNLVPLVNIKIAGKRMFIPLKMVSIGIDPYPNLKKNNKYYLNHSQCIGVIVILWYVTCTKRLHLSPTPSIHLAPTTGRRCHQNGPQCWYQHLPSLNCVPSRQRLCHPASHLSLFDIVWPSFGVLVPIPIIIFPIAGLLERAHTHTTVPHIILV